MQNNERFLELMRALTTFEPRVVEETPSLRIRSFGFPQYSPTARGGAYESERSQIESRLIQKAKDLKLSLTPDEAPRVIEELELFREQLRRDVALAYNIAEIVTSAEPDFRLDIECNFKPYTIPIPEKKPGLRDQAYVFGWHELANALLMSNYIAAWLLVEIGRTPRLTKKLNNPGRRKTTETNHGNMTKRYHSLLGSGKTRDGAIHALAQERNDFGIRTDDIENAKKHIRRVLKVNGIN